MEASGVEVVTTSESAIWGETVRAVEAGSEGGNLDLWLRQARLVSITDGVARVAVLNEFCREWIRDRYLVRLRALLGAQVGTPVDIALEVTEPAERPVASAVPAAPAVRARGGAEPQAVHPRYTFDRFVTGPSNQLAAEAARSIAERLGEATHPLYIYAPSGLGKTHLLSAIAHAVSQKRPAARIAYLPTQRFVEEFVHAVRGGAVEAFDRKYRDECDLLLLDDVHVLRRKDGTQERFFHIFNALYDRRAPIVMTSDQWPREIPDIEERLRTRFLWGLIVDIQPPEYETRVAILRRKAEDEGIELPDEVAQLVASRVTGSVRELEGVLGRLAAQAEITARPIDVALAQDVLAVLLPAAPVACTVDELQRAVCNLFGIHLADLRGPSRRRSVTLPRHIAMYLARDGLRQPFPAIAERFGGRDHTTVMAACRHVVELLESDPPTRNIVASLRKQLGLP
ncbi:MAG: chromosomal replication initiator protein DnaA [Deltaproteobacteria bacterium]|nr:chromosomal replication initiator protein DnaA [Deltaproteobacteria bacterium]